MKNELFVSLLEIALRTEAIIAHHASLPTGVPIGPDTVEIALPEGRLLISATDETELSADLRLARHRAVANSGTPTCWLTVSSPWDLGWSHEPACHCTFLDPIFGMAVEIADGRLAFEAGSVALADTGGDRWLSISADGWTLMRSPVSSSYLHAARAAAIGAWQEFVARPARLV